MNFTLFIVIYSFIFIFGYIFGRYHESLKNNKQTINRYKRQYGVDASKIDKNTMEMMKNW